MPLIGREEEIESVSRRWRRAKAGDGRIVLLTGEPGIGKSRLLVELQTRLAIETHASLRYFCSPLHQGSALYPVIARWEQETGFARGDTAEQRLHKLKSILAPDEFSARGHRPARRHAWGSDQYWLPTARPSPQQRKERTFALLHRRLASLAKRQPVLMLFEDAHWSDHSS